jgi:hypothetical protein
MFVGHFDLEELEMGDPQTSNNTPYRVTCRSADLSFPFDRPIICKRVKLLDDQKEMKDQLTYM